MEALRALTGIAIAAVDFSNHRRISRLERHARADRIAVGCRAHELELDPMPRPCADVAVEQRRLIGVRLVEIEPAIVIEVADADAAAVLVVVDAGQSRDLRKAVAVEIPKELFLLIATPRHRADARPARDVAEI